MICSDLNIVIIVCILQHGNIVICCYTVSLFFCAKSTSMTSDLTWRLSIPSKMVYFRYNYGITFSNIRKHTWNKFTQMQFQLDAFLFQELKYTRGALELLPIPFFNELFILISKWKFLFVTLFVLAPHFFSLLNKKTNYSIVKQLEGFVLFLFFY